MTSKLISGVLLGVLVFITSMTVEAAEFSGSWKGTLSGTDGSAADVQIEFSPQGFPLYTYINNKGLARQAELSQVGQTVEYVPAGGGVQRVVVKSVEKRQGGFRSTFYFPLKRRVRAICSRTGNGLIRLWTCPRWTEDGGDDPSDVPLRR